MNIWIKDLETMIINQGHITEETLNLGDLTVITTEDLFIELNYDYHNRDVIKLDTKVVENLTKHCRYLIEYLSTSKFIYHPKKGMIYSEIENIIKYMLQGEFIPSNTTEVHFIPRGYSPISIDEIGYIIRYLLLLNNCIFNESHTEKILFLDKPENNIHPKNQILIARIIVLLVNAGVKVFVNTLSDVILREISNCIMLNNVSNKDIVELENRGYTIYHKLSSSKVKAYFKGNYTSLNPVEITQEQGIFMKTFDEPIDSKNENQEEIFEKGFNESIKRKKVKKQ